MFTDARSKRIVFVAHCILNQNSISDGTADFPGSNVKAVQALLDANVGIVQLPCPELCCLGLDRSNEYGADSPVVVENTRIRGQIQKLPASERLAEIVEQVIYQILQYHQHGFDILGIIGINRSPCCGVDTTSFDDMEREGQGVFIAAIRHELEKAALDIPLIGIKTNPNYIEKLKTLLY